MNKIIHKYIFDTNNLIRSSWRWGSIYNWYFTVRIQWAFDWVKLAPDRPRNSPEHAGSNIL